MNERAWNLRAAVLNEVFVECVRQDDTYGPLVAPDIPSEHVSPAVLEQMAENERSIAAVAIRRIEHIRRTITRDQPSISVLHYFRLAKWQFTDGIMWELREILGKDEIVLSSTDCHATPSAAKVWAQDVISDLRPLISVSLDWTPGAAGPPLNPETHIAMIFDGSEG